jgi:hemoglobin
MAINLMHDTNMPPVPESNIYATIGEEGFARLVSAFYKQVKTDSILGPMYPIDDLEGAEHRLREFLIQRLGGPTRYSDERGHPRLRMRHAPFPIDIHARNRWVELMNNAMTEAQLPAEVIVTLKPYFANTATFMMNR